MDNFHQHYPTYRYKERDVVLREFENAQRIANTQSQLFGQLSNILLGIVAISFTLFLRFYETNDVIKLGNFLPNYLHLIVLLYTSFSFILLVYFTELQKTIILNVRKTIILRKILGLDYGSLQLVLPNWRIEGATNPFAIKMFPGWINLISFPFWILLISINVILYIVFHNFYIPWYYFNILVSGFFTYQFRKKLYDTHETFWLSFIKVLSSIIGLRLVKNFEYIIYRAKLSVNELDRLEINRLNIKKILIAIEDKRFYEHRGIDFRALIRGFLSNFSYFRLRKGYLKSGGSTLTMQLARTLFIQAEDYNKFIRRKIIEILLSLFWLDKKFTKEEILNIYLSAVRFAENTNGIKAAADYFFDKHNKKNLSNEEAFLLIERLSNVKSLYSESRIKVLLKEIQNVSPLIFISQQELFKLYKRVEKSHKIKKG